MCVTPKRPCCRTPPNRIGEWLYPNGSAILKDDSGNSFYRDRGDDGTVRLHRRGIASLSAAMGQYCCEIPNANGITQRLCVHFSKFNCIIVHSTIDVLLAAVDSSPKIELLIAGQTYRNNSVIELSEGFETNQSLSLVCATEKHPCCNSSVIGEWYYPNNMTAVPNVEAGNTFYTSRGDDGTVHLHLRNITTFLSNTTQFCCELPNINNLNQRLCVHLSEYNYVILLITVHDIIHNADPTIFEEEEMSTTVYPGGFIQVRLLGIADCYNWVVRSLL